VEVVNLDACDTGVTRCDLFQQQVSALPACSPASSTKFNACQPTSLRPHGVTQINTTESSYCSWLCPARLSPHLFPSCRS